MASNVVLASNFNTQKISFSQLRVLDSGGKQAYINYDGGMFVFQTPNCGLPYGMSAFDKAGPVKYSVELSLRGYDDPSNKMKGFHDALSRLDEFMIDQGVKNSKQWFKSDLSRDVIKAFYTPMVRLAKDKEGNPKPILLPSNCLYARSATRRSLTSSAMMTSAISTRAFLWRNCW